LLYCGHAFLYPPTFAEFDALLDWSNGLDALEPIRRTFFGLVSTIPGCADRWHSNSIDPATLVHLAEHQDRSSTVSPRINWWKLRELLFEPLWLSTYTTLDEMPAGLRIQP
jgi:hypothetical protein